MNVVTHELENGRRELHVTVAAEEWDGHVDAIGSADEQTAAKKALFDIFGKAALDDVSPSPVTVPVMVAKEDLSAGEPFAFAVSYLPAIQLELSGIPELDVEVPSVEIGDAEVDDEIRRIVRENPIMRGKIPGEVVENGSSIEMYLRAEKDGKIFPGLCGAREYTLGEGFLPEEFDRNLLGVRAGDKVEFPFKLQADEGEDLVDIVVHIDVNKVYVNDLDAVSDDWVRFNFPGFGSIGQLKEAIRQEMARYIGQRVADMRLEKIIEQLYAHMNQRVPDWYIEALYDEAQRVLQKGLDEAGVTYENYLKSMGTERDTFELEMLLDVRAKAVVNAVLDAYARYDAIGVSDAERESYLLQLGDQIEQGGAAFDGVPLYRSSADEAIKRRKAADRLQEIAVAR